MLKTRLVISCLLGLLVSACSTVSITPPATPQTVNKQQRQQLVKQLNHWQINGKIAFIQHSVQGKHKESASMHWLVDEPNKQQELNLTTFLGINVFNLSSANGWHQVKVDGKSYQSDDLNQLLSSLTHYALPTHALSYWLKGLAYQVTDQLEFDAKTHLPSKLKSFNQGKLWHISYGDYQLVEQIPLAHKFTLSTAQLTIKLHIKQWQLNP
jgi:outer membrane lipoprotein LolB